jgi:hypothetical protein
MYGSRPGNPPSITAGDPKIEGEEGTVGFRQAYVKNVGFGPEVGYGIRLGSDGSYLINSTIVNTGGPAVANTFASGENPRQHPSAFDGVLLRNVDIIQPDGVDADPGSGVRLNNHQDSIKPQREWTSVTTFENVDIEASEPVARNLAGGEEPVVRGSWGSNADPTPPPGAPGSPVRAASGVGGGAGSIGGSVGGPGGVNGGILAAAILAIVFIVAVPLLLIKLVLR